MSGLKGKAVLLTGASSGIGWAAAKALAREGCRLTLAARREDKLKELAARLGGEVQTVAWDVSDWRRAHELIETARARWGRLDILVNNAGIMASARFHEQSLDEIESVMRTNYLGAAALSRAALPLMLAQKDGHVVSLASVAGLLGLPYMASYCASKFALVGMSEALRREYYGSGIAFTAICPGSVDTPMAADSLKDPGMGRWAHPKTAEQVAEIIVDCCLERDPEIVFGDAPAALIRLARFMPRLVDWVIHQGARRLHPLARGT